MFFYYSPFDNGKQKKILSFPKEIIPFQEFQLIVVMVKKILHVLITKHHFSLSTNYKKVEKRKWSPSDVTLPSMSMWEG